MSDRPADHHGDEFVHGHLVDLTCADEFAVTEHRHPVADLMDLLQTVGDINDADSLLFEAVDGGEELLDLTVREGSRRLVHNEDLGLDGEGLGHLHHLLLGHAQADDLGPGVNVHIQAVQQLQTLGMHPGLIQEPPAMGKPALKDVLGHAHVGHQIELLVDDADAEFLRLARVDQAYFLAVQDDRPGIGRVGAGQYLHQRGFSRPVFAQEDVHLPGVQVKVHIAERQDAGKSLSDSFCLE